jgi:predicted dinucleotide-binding enzyme
MEIAILGSGNVGKALASSFTRAGHSVTLTAPNPDNARAAATQTGAQAADSNQQAVGALDGKVLIDPADPGSVLDGTSAAEQIQARVPGARWVKAFNTALASRQADPVVDGVALDGYLAGDDDQAKQTVAELVSSIGFRPVDVGPLVMARALEALALLKIMLQIRNNWPWQAGFKLVGPTS